MRLSARCVKSEPSHSPCGINTRIPCLRVFISTNVPLDSGEGGIRTLEHPLLPERTPRFGFLPFRGLFCFWGFDCASFFAYRQEVNQNGTGQNFTSTAAT